MGTDSIDRNSGIPAYRQLAAILKRRIGAGEFDPEPNRRLPAEVDLAAEYDVAHGTVRKALEVLRDEAGLVRTAPGLGTFVLPPGERGRASP